ncbi:lycopene cyclase domain-containing protein [Cryobacterium zhongshanensis]|uniref:Lycopene cyclase domain-containing protein n=1 Tax=Cryobacterium zhongshanensis TaxID=2928153 RepID=A0AA41QWA4_9MICO|nr:lycopene cyclase domain-containing protein [Cryobacterium zhongshanensis]MCI4658649.1 lycopene cyclase domain-containing protein [Cryobacterium zhongshanensis]
MSYVLLDLMFLGCALLVTFAAVLLRRQQLSRQNVWAVAVALLCVLILTAVFDNVMIGVGLVAYDPGRITGFRVGLAPIEDFAYPIAVALLLPALWTLLPARRAPGWNPDGHLQHTGSASGVGSAENTDVDTGTSQRSGPNLNTTTNASPGPHPRSATSGGNR